MAYSFQIGVRYLRSKKRATVSMITAISVVGVALGVAALLAVLSITTGFEKAFRDKVLGVNAHVLILKYGREFSEYRDVLSTVRAMPEVSGAAPFLINEMMLTHGDRRAVVLVKGVTPQGVREVLDLPNQMIAGSLDGLSSKTEPSAESHDDAADPDWDWLRDFSKPPEDAVGRETIWEQERRRAHARERERAARLSGSKASKKGPGPKVKRVGAKLANPAAVEDALDALAEDAWALPDDFEWEAALSVDGGEGAAGALPGIVVGKTLAQDLELKVGDQVTLISPLAGLDLSMAGPDAAPTRLREFAVVGVFEAGFQEYDSRLVYTDLFEAQQLYEDGDNVTGVELRVFDLQGSEKLARRIEQELGGAFHTLDWSELNRNLFTALEMQKVVLTLVIATIIFVAAFNVIATLIMIVLEKKREIAILKAMGASDFTVLSVFMVQGVLVGVIGTVCGVLLGGGVVAYLSRVQFPLDPNVYLIDHLPVVLNPTVFLLTVSIALLICTVSTIAPSWWAARMLPADGLRYE